MDIPFLRRAFAASRWWAAALGFAAVGGCTSRTTLDQPYGYHAGQCSGTATGLVCDDYTINVGYYGGAGQHCPFGCTAGDGGVYTATCIGTPRTDCTTFSWDECNVAPGCTWSAP